MAVQFNAHGQEKKLNLKISATASHGKINIRLMSCAGNIACGSSSSEWNFEFDKMSFDDFNDRLTKFLNATGAQFEMDARAFAEGCEKINSLIQFYDSAPAFAGENVYYKITAK
jgi:hypothetical protein